jgi:hypothetical protein
MSKDFVPFELAVKLKEKGYPQCVYGIYHMLDACYVEEGEFFEKGCITEAERAYTAPTISQVLKWLREKYLIHISTKPYPCEDGVMWMYEVRKFNTYIVAVVANKTGFVKEEQAALSGIECALPMI